MARYSKPSWSLLWDEFHCRGCGGREAYHSRARGVFEKHVLPLFFMQTVRCERCDQRLYVFQTVEALERSQFSRKESQGELSSGSRVPQLQSPQSSDQFCEQSSEQSDERAKAQQSDGSRSDTRVA